METNEELRDRHHFSLKGIFVRYIITKILKSYALWVSVIIAIVLSLLIGINNEYEQYYFTLQDLIKIALSLFPNFLGFCIGGYALIIGASNVDVLKKMSRPLEKRGNLSYFQVLSSTFAMSLIIQCLTLFTAYVIHIILELKLNAITYEIGIATNMILIFVMLLFSSMSILFLYYTIINIFNFGQAIHFSIRLDQRDQNNKNDK